MSLGTVEMNIAYQGEPGAYSEAAARRFNSEADVSPRETFDDVFKAVKRGEVTHGILPIENSVAGTIHRNYDLLLEHELPIVGEVQLPIVHNLLAHAGTSIAHIRWVYSHPQALAQCERFLRTLHKIELVATYDTAGSAKMIHEGELRDAGAIASERAGQVFGLTVLQSEIQDYADNITRFLLVSREVIPFGIPDKTTVVFALGNEAGALFKALSVFALREIVLTKLESRPIPGRPFEYLFYVDLIADSQELRCSRALAHLAEFAPLLRTLGSYPHWKEPDRK